MSLRQLLVLPLIFIAACAQGAAGPLPSHDANASVQKFDPKAAFQPSENVMADVDATLARAATNDKLALLVLGANWCHDSRGFVKTLNDPKLNELITAQYEIVFVDVGYLDRARDVIERFGMPVIYGTPTVLVVEPGTDLLINRQDMHRWRDAAKIDVDEAIDYFERMAATEALDEAVKDKDAIPVTLTALYEEINAFEKAQAERIYGGFAILGPMLAMERGERPEEFEGYWGQVRDLRYQITDDLAELRSEARNRVAAGETEISLNYPEYSPFDWE